MTTQPTVEELKTQANALVNAGLALAECIREIGSVPNGHLYARVMEHLSFETYSYLIDQLKKANLIREENYLLIWIGPDKAPVTSNTASQS